MARSTPHLGTLVLLTAWSVLTLNMFLPALPAMKNAFGVSEATIGLAISGYMALAAVLQLLLGPISDRVGRRPVLLGALAVYAAASALCLVATDFAVFLIGRMGQSVAVAGAVLSSAVVRDLHGEREAAARLSTIAAAMAIAPMIAPVVGGLLDAQAGWRSIFVLYTAIGAVSFALVWIDLRETRRPGPSPRREAYTALLGSPAFWAYASCMSFSVGAYYVFLAGAPFVGAQVFGLGAGQIGVGLGSITAGYMAGAAVSARIVARVGPDRLILAGRWCALLGVVTGLVLFLFTPAQVLLLFGATVFVGVGNGLTIANAYSGALSIRPDLAGTAAGLSGALMLAVGAGLTAAATAFLSGSATPARLLGLMLISVGLSFVAAVIALRRRRGEGTFQA